MLWGVCELMPEIMTAAGSGQEFLCIRMVRPACFQVLLTSYVWHLGLLCPGGRRIPEQHGGDLKMQVNMKNLLVVYFPVWLISWNLLKSHVPRFSFWITRFLWGSAGGGLQLRCGQRCFANLRVQHREWSTNDKRNFCIQYSKPESWYERMNWSHSTVRFFSLHKYSRPPVLQDTRLREALEANNVVDLTEFLAPAAGHTQNEKQSPYIA